jgi:hypothetical protein
VIRWPFTLPRIPDFRALGPVPIPEPRRKTKPIRKPDP